jgi:hypothetical protein
MRDAFSTLVLFQSRLANDVRMQSTSLAIGCQRILHAYGSYFGNCYPFITGTADNPFAQFGLPRPLIRFSRPLRAGISRCNAEASGQHRCGLLSRFTLRSFPPAANPIFPHFWATPSYVRKLHQFSRKKWVTQVVCGGIIRKAQKKASDNASPAKRAIVTSTICDSPELAFGVSVESGARGLGGSDASRMLDRRPLHCKTTATLLMSGF